MYAYVVFEYLLEGGRHKPVNPDAEAGTEAPIGIARPAFRSDSHKYRNGNFQNSVAQI